MAQATLTANVILNGQVSNSFGLIGTALVNMGNQINRVSQQLIDFGKESVKVYSNYEYNMAQAAAVWDVDEESRKFRQLDEATRSWAESTIFHTSDVSNAVQLAAHAGWSMEDVMDRMPAVMRLAQAGSMDLSEAMEYVSMSMKALGVESNEIDHFVDLWIYASNKSTGNAKTFGDTMLRMGSTMRFAANPEELFAMIGAIHNMGTTGSEAGTQLRNAMLRLMAPTKQAFAAMSELDQAFVISNLQAQGFTDITLENFNDKIDEADAEAQKMLAGLRKYEGALGFSVYDEAGQVRPMLDVYHDLGSALSVIAGGWDKIGSNEQTVGILKDVFGVRSITGPLNLLNAYEEAYQICNDMMGGAAEGTGAQMAERMMGTLYGQTELLKSAWEEFENTVGKSLSGKIEEIENAVTRIIQAMTGAAGDGGEMQGGVLDWIATGLNDIAEVLENSDFDGGEWALLSGALEGIAAVGPTLLTSGMAMIFLGWALGTTAGQVALAATALVALVSAIDNYNEKQLHDAFGDMNLDTTELDNFLDTLKTEFNDATEQISGFRSQLSGIKEDYLTISETFAQSMLNALITGREITDEDMQKWLGYSDQMTADALQAAQVSGSYWEAMMIAMWTPKGGNAAETLADPAFQAMMEVINGETDDLVSDITEASNAMRAAILSAFEDGELSDEEYLQIKGYYQALNDAMTQAQMEAQSEEDYVRQKMLMDKATEISLSDMQDYIDKEVIPQRDEEIKKWSEYYYTGKYRLERRQQRELDELHAKAAEDSTVDLEAGEAEINQRYAKMQAEWEEQYQQRVQEYRSTYDDMIAEMWTIAIRESDFGGMYGKAIDIYTQGGSIKEAKEALKENAGWLEDTFVYTQADMLEDSMEEAVDNLGGVSNIFDLWQQANKRGDAEKASTYWNLLLASMPEDGRFIPVYDEEMSKTYSENTPYYYRYNPENFELRDLFELGIISGVSERGYSYDFNKFYAYNEAMDAIMDAADELYMNGGAAQSTEYERQLTNLLTGRGDYTIANEEQLTKLLNIDEGLRALWENDRFSFVGNMLNAGALSYNSELNALMFDKDAWLANGSNLQIRLTTNAKEAVASANETFQNDLQTSYNIALNPTVGGAGLDGYATGGRATRPAIFGEAGPEWFIPEQHTRRTAQLLVSAMRASGFDLSELADIGGAQYFADGGVFGEGIPTLDWGDTGAEESASGESINITYSPNITYGGGAEELERILSEDKRRFVQAVGEALEERALRHSIMAMG